MLWRHAGLPFTEIADLTVGTPRKKTILGASWSRDTLSAYALSALKQAAGVGVVNNAMNELDRTTQQNTTLVEALTRSTDSLRDSSTRLVQAVGFFRANPTS